MKYKDAGVVVKSNDCWVVKFITNNRLQSALAKP